MKSVCDYLTFEDRNSKSSMHIISMNRYTELRILNIMYILYVGYSGAVTLNTNMYNNCGANDL